MKIHSDPSSLKQSLREIIDTATKCSMALVEAREVSERFKISAERYKRIHDLSLALISDPGNPLRPDAEALARIAGANKIPFLAVQSLKNSYRDMISIWTGAYDKIATAKAEYLSTGNPSKNSRRTEFDAERQSYHDVIRTLYIENCELKRQLKQAPSQVGIGGHTARPEPIELNGDDFVGFEPVRKWIKELDNEKSPIRVTDLGLKLNRNARPDFTIMSLKVFKILKSL